MRELIAAITARRVVSMEKDIVRAWVEGWAVSRGAAPPAEESWGFTIDIGTPKSVTRHVLPAADEQLIKTFMATATAPGIWLKMFVPPETLGPWLVPGWTFDAPGFLMSSPLRSAPAPVPDGFRLRTWSRGGVTRVLVTDADGGFGARGQIALPPAGGTAVIDQIETSGAHRRKGLGTLVMRTLGNAAAEAGVPAGVLGASVEGRALYESLGWRTLGPLTGVFLEQADA
ncbi:GNAT family N-acetyltransferase [Streptomyces litchfieldiae]|uniref:GNAT family N-acetyltransferase n=1 Tax=Streptomyces litchfieldiae TaxID=3075543 RepID=A0ABU2MMN2_9ACTN|nr:GNAT family N-acetyltransferase [Streptomyces sp. DSM 44938]MDT0342877.1 GNAT family N-acetyltransferase [Streptomyces sp. DSM 44938]